jgi:predicted aspartyl protease
MRRIFRAVSFAALSFGFAGCAASAGDHDSQAACTVERQAVLPMALRNGQLIIPGTLNGSTVSLVLDTGSEGAVVTPLAAARFALPADPRGKATIFGTSGTFQTGRVLLRGLQIGGYEFPPQLVPVASLQGAAAAGPPPDGLVGAEILSFFDIDFDFPRRRMTLYDVQNCAGHFLPWHAPYSAVPIRRTPGNLLVLPVRLDGHPLHALFDTGANRGRVNRQAALAAGVTVAALAQDPRGNAHGVGGAVAHPFVHRFATLQVGRELFRDVTLEVGGRNLPTGDMLLGLPYMLSRRIWLSYATGEMFVERRLPIRPAPPPG